MGESSRKRGPNWGVVLVLGACVLFGLAILLLVRSLTDNGPPAVPAQRAQEAAPSAERAAIPVAPSQNEVAPAAAPAAEQEASPVAESRTDAPVASATAPRAAQAASGTVYVTKTGKKYHRAGCSYLAKSSSPMSKGAAIAAGYTACSRCSP